MKLSKKQTFVTALVLLLIIAGGITAFFAVSSESDNSSSQNRPTAKQQSSAEGSSGIIETQAVAKDSKKYAGKTVQVSGRIYQANPNTYFIVDKEEKTTALTLDFTQTKLNIGDYLSTSPANNSQNAKLRGPYIVTGKVAEADEQKAVRLIVTAINEE